ncbi:hypothetical protein BDV27DRAFT_119460 [Aspergillus caelatus]|uniref:Uncharacterized protein n=1 Tax=Aspergillus caelatus TaxID=61420 RepID=A0A5N7AKK0_9EURO|nr:uncharacterized protein BDV27DRAFT_119460 [Aspergillus caelatus]KAE8370454.1 hypothetical protein BDV27DRAFT_119460 [Aspergillus caelatus]
MKAEGSTSNIQNALSIALVSVSAFTLSNDSRWTIEATTFRGQTFNGLKTLNRTELRI